MDATLARIADYAADLREADLPPAVVHECKRRLIDTLGCAVAGFDAEPSRAARRLALRAHVDHGATVLGTRRQALPELAAFANGVMLRVLDGNDCCPGGGGHPSDAIAAILAVGEMVDASGAATIVAIALAYELHHALFRAAGLFNRGFDHPLYTAIASAAAAAKLMRLERERIAQAVSLAATANLALGATRRGELSLWKGCAGANAARNGVFAALLAREGVTGPAGPFEGTHGLAELIGGLKLGPLARAGEPFRIMQTDMKWLATEYHSQGPIAAALQLREGLDLDDIASIAIHTYAFAYREIGSGPEKWRPRTRETADHSLPYTVAAVLVDGAFSDGIYRPERFDDPRVLALADRITVHEDPSLSAQVPRAFPCRMETTLADRSTRTAALRYPHGHHEDPLTDAEVEAKFRTLAGRRLNEAALDRVLKTVESLEHRAHVAELLDLLYVV